MPAPGLSTKENEVTSDNRTNEQIAKVNIDGNGSSGYYCHSINLHAKGHKNG